MKHNILSVLRVIFVLALALVLTQAAAPVQTARAQEQTPVSDLEVKLVTVPQNSRACDVFQAIYTVKNLGPDPAYYVSIMVHIPDAYHDIALLGVPYMLAVGETATISAVIWVGGYEPGETSHAWVGITASSTSDDPNFTNNETRKEMKIVSKPVLSCLPRY